MADEKKKGAEDELNQLRAQLIAERTAREQAESKARDDTQRLLAENEALRSGGRPSPRAAAADEITDDRPDEETIATTMIATQRCSCGHRRQVEVTYGEAPPPWPHRHSHEPKQTPTPAPVRRPPQQGRRR